MKNVLADRVSEKPSSQSKDFIKIKLQVNQALEGTQHDLPPAPPHRQILPQDPSAQISRCFPPALQLAPGTRVSSIVGDVESNGDDECNKGA